MLLLPQDLLKDSEFKGCRPSITAILSSAACMNPDSNLPLVTFWHSLAESPGIDSPGCAESCKSGFDGECKDSHILQTIALRALLCRVNTLSMQNLWLNLFRVPHAAPHRCCFCLKACSKTLSSKDAGPASLPSCPRLLAWIRTAIFHWSRFGTAWLKVLELTRLDVLKAVWAVSIGNARIATSCKQ